MARVSRSLSAFVLLGLAGIGPLASPASAGPEGQMVLAQTISIAARWFDPAEAEGIITPYIFYYALHDALVKPLPGNPLTPCLAESWSASADGLSYEFVLRKGARFHNGEPVTAEDVKFSFERYKGAAAKTLRHHVATVEIVDSHRVRFRLKHPWPDFMTFYIEGLISEQATELDRGKREAILHRIQQLMHEKVMFAPIFELASLGGYGPRVEESGLGLIPHMAASAPDENLRLKGK